MRLNRKIKIAVTFASIIVATPTFSQSVKENSENWQVTSAWVKEVTPEQQAHAVFSAFSALNKKIAEIIQHNQDGEQLLWVAKITACGTSMLAKVSTKNPDIENNLQQVSDLYVAFIRGEKPNNKFVERDEQLRREGISIFNKINPNLYKETAITFKRRFFETDRSLVVYAMMCATPRTN